MHTLQHTRKTGRTHTILQGATVAGRMCAHASANIFLPSKEDGVLIGFLHFIRTHAGAHASARSCQPAQHPLLSPPSSPPPSPFSLPKNALAYAFVHSKTSERASVCTHPCVCVMCSRQLCFIYSAAPKPQARTFVTAPQTRCASRPGAAEFPSQQTATATAAAAAAATTIVLHLTNRPSPQTAQQSTLEARARV